MVRLRPGVFGYVCEQSSALGQPEVLGACPLK